jgi:hypothetical protein
MTMNEDQRQAGGLKIGISNYVATAALAVLAGAAGLFTYISQSFDPPWTFYGLMIVAALALVASIVIGGDGADATVASIAEGEWDNSKTWQFNAQSVLTLLGLVLVLAATAVGATSTQRIGEPERLERLEAQMIQLQSLIDRRDKHLSSHSRWGHRAHHMHSPSSR